MRSSSMVWSMPSMMFGLLGSSADGRPYKGSKHRGKITLGSRVLRGFCEWREFSNREGLRALNRSNSSFDGALPAQRSCPSRSCTQRMSGSSPSSLLHVGIPWIILRVSTCSLITLSLELGGVGSDASYSHRLQLRCRGFLSGPRPCPRDPRMRRRRF